jgi:predicted adenine nucleotide alpha hydrolase (AANH) superfamily ATPase
MNNIDTLEKYKNFIASNSEKKVKILIHACCAPCSSEVLNELKQHAEITIYYYNPNTYPYEEYMKRYDEFSKLPYKFDVINEQYNEQEYLDYVNEFKLLKEGSLRCYKCYELRLNAKYFELIKNKTKTIEMRLLDEKRQQYQIGDILIFKKRPEENEILKTQIINLHKFKSFSDIYNRFNKIKLGYAENEDANPEDMNSFYPIEEQEKYGVVGIEIEVI